MSVLDDDIKKVFSRYDYNDNSTLEESEVMKLLKDVADELDIKVPSEKELKTLMSTFDINKDGTINFPEFLKMFPALKNMKE